MFMTFGERCLMSLDRWVDVTLQMLYTTARDIGNNKQTLDQKSLETLQVISEVHERQYTKIKNCLLQAPPNVSKSLQYINDGISYSGRLKRKYEEADLHEEDKYEESVTPIEEPPDIPSSSSYQIDLPAMRFVEGYIAKNKGRTMDWRHCFEEG